jgi:hypothetical protein
VILWFWETSRYFTIRDLPLSLAPQPSLGLGLLRNLLPLKNGWISCRLLNNFLFYRVGLLAPRPTSALEDQASVFISPRDRVTQLCPQAPGTQFSRLLRQAWVTVGLFLFPGHHTGKQLEIFEEHSLTCICKWQILKFCHILCTKWLIQKTLLRTSLFIAYSSCF